MLTQEQRSAATAAPRKARNAPKALTASASGGAPALGRLSLMTGMHVDALAGQLARAVARRTPSAGEPLLGDRAGTLELQRMPSNRAVTSRATQPGAGTAERRLQRTVHIVAQMSYPTATGTATTSAGVRIARKDEIAEFLKGHNAVKALARSVEDLKAFIEYVMTSRREWAIGDPSMQELAEWKSILSVYATSAKHGRDWRETEKRVEGYDLYESEDLAQGKLRPLQLGARNATLLYVTAAESDRWTGQRFYRGMGQVEFGKLAGFNLLDPPGYGGITATRGYSADYMSGKGKYTHVVEFLVLPGIDLEDELKKVGVPKKTEDGATSYGLGPEQCKGVGGVIFNDHLADGTIGWRLVDAQIDLSLAHKRRKDASLF